MNKILLAIIIAIFAYVGDSVAQQPSMAFPKTFVSDSRSYDFGTILEKAGKKSHTFTFRNNGNAPVVISGVSAFCGCTSVDYAKRPVLPGKTAKVSVTYNPANRPGKFSKEVTLILNDGKAYTRVWVKGSVTPYRHPVKEDYPYYFGHGLYMGLKTLNFSRSVAKIEQRVSNETDKNMTIVFRITKKHSRLVQMPHKMVLKPWQRSTFNVVYNVGKAGAQDMSFDAALSVNGMKAKSLGLRLIR